MLKSIPHKINLGLHIIEKLPSGFHNIETIFYPCNNYEDTIEIIPSSRFSFSIINADFTCEMDHNLCVKAYRLLQKEYNLPPVNIALHKKIPSGSGLGGGSANAATTLVILNELFSINLSTKQLHHFATQLGSDTAFFLYNTPMYATGKGDIFETICLDLSKYKIVIIAPNISISTKDAYNAIIPKKTKSDIKQIINLPIEKWKNHLVNDFEKVTFKQYPSLRKIKNDFYEKGAVYASMSGSGSAIFGIFTTKSAFEN
ncbi:MAG: 4-(cytidine 5'-diphospho)-2-C-methyl-D-erythritol kinase [Bacteroidales bacterium]|jgi:4-diphosphocytidyl-2-C-methyl-D-erythritol kinase|nr:4-(cytidine 5'-diphospho)-2-C-methyl-D-erythritol kinase [Bacteroidales bacterium]